jgi:lactoylglutathione lyase
MDLDSFPILTVDDLAGVVGFYERLGFSRRYAFPAEGDPVFVTLARGRADRGRVGPPG